MVRGYDFHKVSYFGDPEEHRARHLQSNRLITRNLSHLKNHGPGLRSRHFHVRS